MASLNDLVRPPWPSEGDERTVATQLLQFHRATLAIKCRSLSDQQLTSRPIASSNLSLLGLLRHMREVERYWFEEIFLGSAAGALLDNTVDPDGDFNDLFSHPVPVVVDSWLEQIDGATHIVRQHSFDDVSVLPVEWTGQKVNLRFIVVHLIEEYARHCGHADLLREAIDGATGH